jgi:hypothetical protein
MFTRIRGGGQGPWVEKKAEKVGLSFTSASYQVQRSNEGARNAAKFGARSRQKPNPKRAHAFKSLEPARLKKLRQLLRRQGDATIRGFRIIPLPNDWAELRSQSRGWAERS